MFRVVGTGGGGVGDVPAFTDIRFGLLTTTGYTIYQLSHQAESASGFKIKIQRFPASTVISVSVNWLAYVPSNDPAGSYNPGAWTVPGSGNTEEIFGDTTHEKIVYLPSVTTALFEVNLATSSSLDGFSGTYTWVQYSGDSGVSWHDLCAGQNPQIVIDGTVGGTSGLHTSASCSIDRSFFPASNFVTLRVVAFDPVFGNLDTPSFNLIMLHVL